MGYITALRDDRHPVAYSLLESAPLFPHLRPVGRLDLETSGLLLWTTDGTLLQRLTHPKRAVPRTYHAALARPFRAPPADLVLEDGHRPNLVDLALIEPEATHPALARRPRRPVMPRSRSWVAPTTRCAASLPRSTATCWRSAGPPSDGWSCRPTSPRANSG